MRRRARGSLRRQLGVCFVVWAFAFAILAFASALPGPPEAVLSVDDRTPFVNEPVRFDASGSRGHDAGQGRIVAYLFDFGDGRGTEWQESPFADHAYRDAGTFEGRVTARDGRGFEGRASVQVEARATPPPTGEEPDLIPLDAVPTPAKPRVDDLMSLTVVIRNQGGTAAVNATIAVTDLRPSGASATVGTIRLAGPVEPGAIRILVTPTFVAVEAGRHEFRIAIREVVPVETLTGNNERTVPVHVAAAGDDGFEARGLDPLPVALAFAALGAAAAAAALLGRRREPGERGPGPPEPPGQEPPPPWPP